MFSFDLASLAQYSVMRFNDNMHITIYHLVSSQCVYGHIGMYNIPLC